MLLRREDMNRALLLVALAALAGCSSNRPAAPAASQPAAPNEQQSDAEAPEAEAKNPLAEKADELFSGAAKEGTFAGSVVIVDGGKTILVKGYGDADRKNKKPNETATIFRIGSLTKQFTATAILALADDGKLSVTDPVSKFFPEYPKENLVKDGVEVTLHHLLSHTSGLPDGRKTEYFGANVWKKPIDVDALIGEAKLLPLVRKPGAKFEYLNYGYLLLGVVVERVSGQGYESFVRSRFFEPLGMKDTGTILPADKKEREATGYYKAKSGSFQTIKSDPTFRDRDLSFAFGSGQIYATAGDLALWERALEDGKVKGQDLLFKANLDGYGYGWAIENAGGVEHFWHNGAISPLGFSSFFVRVPSKQRMIAYLSNLDIDITAHLEAKVAELAIE